MGCLVMLMTRSHVLPWLSIILGLLSTSSGMGRRTIRLLHSPVLNPVKPAMTPCTAFCASCMQYRLSTAFAGTLLIM